MKKEFKEPQVMILETKNEDIITTSIFNGTGTYPENPWSKWHGDRGI